MADVITAERLIGCEIEKKDNSGCEFGFVPSAEKIGNLISERKKDYEFIW